MCALYLHNANWDHPHFANVVSLCIVNPKVKREKSNSLLLYATKYLGSCDKILLNLTYFLDGCPILGRSKYTTETNFYCQMTTSSQTSQPQRKSPQRWQPRDITFEECELVCFSKKIYFNHWQDFIVFSYVSRQELKNRV